MNIKNVIICNFNLKSINIYCIYVIEKYNLHTIYFIYSIKIKKRGVYKNGHNDL